ncbi:hypothetical protein DS830_04835 [Bombilactobacillus bombi]|nr:hypothetical protein DS830_04835 [Bombilactobacillus bombi]
MRFLNKLKLDFIKNYEFYLLGLMYSILFSTIKIFGDDSINMQIPLKCVLENVYKSYFTWSSRLLLIPLCIIQK